MPSYSKKQLKFIIKLSDAVFEDSGKNTIELTGLRANVEITKAGGAQFSCACCQIFGVPQEDMNDITTLMWTKDLLNKKIIEIYAVDDDNQYETLVFAGDIINAFGFYQAMPDVYLYIQSQSAYYDTLKFYAPTTYRGSIDAATVIGQISKNLGYNFENNGVTAKINNLYAANTGIEQIKAIAVAAGIDLYFDDGTIAICNPNSPRRNYVVEINQSSGMIGYPTFDGVGVLVQTLFNPLITFGGQINISSDIPRANGEWTATSIAHSLNSILPNGAFFSMVRGSISGFAITN